MYEQLMYLAEKLNNIAFNARVDGKMSHDMFIKSMEMVSWLIEEAEIEREKELD